MSEKDILFIIGAILGLIGGYQVGHGRGYIAGVLWCTKRLDDPLPAPPVEAKSD